MTLDDVDRVRFSWSPGDVSTELAKKISSGRISFSAAEVAKWRFNAEEPRDFHGEWTNQHIMGMQLVHSTGDWSPEPESARDKEPGTSGQIVYVRHNGKREPGQYIGMTDGKIRVALRSGDVDFDPADVDIWHPPHLGVDNPRRMMGSGRIFGRGGRGGRKSAETPELSSTHRPLGTHGLWGRKTDQLPAYIQNIAHAMIRDGHDESSAIALAVAAVKRWAAGGNHVTPEVRTASAGALAEWERLRAEHAGKSELAELIGEKSSGLGTGQSHAEEYYNNDSRIRAGVSAELVKYAEAELIKVGPEGYIHGFVCVRPPCGEEPGKIKAADLAVQRDGGIVHRKSGYSVGHIARDDKGNWVVHHADGSKTVRQGTRADALKALARKHNLAHAPSKKPEAVSEDLASIPEVLSSAEQFRREHATHRALAAANLQAHNYTDHQIGQLSGRINKLQAELHADSATEYKMDAITDLIGVIAAVAVLVGTGGFSLAVLGVIGVTQIGAIAPIIAKWINARRGHTEHILTPLKPGEKSAKNDVITALINAFVKAGLDPATANAFVTAVTDKAVAATAAGRFPGDDGFLTAADKKSVLDSIDPSVTPGRTIMKASDLAWLTRN